MPRTRTSICCLTHSCGDQQVHEAQGTEAEITEQQRAWRERPCDGCQQAAAYPAPTLEAAA